MKSEWISVKDRLPEPLVYVLVYIPDDVPYTIREGFLSPSGMWHASLYDRGHSEITHWMPLPKPPKEDDDDR